jgi:hypothetical protein
MYCERISWDSTGTEGTLVPYIDKDSFDGGTTATYYYGVGGDNSNQATLVCVTLGEQQLRTKVMRMV